VEPLQGGFGRLAVRHFHEAKATGLASIFIGNDIDRVHNTIRLEELAEVMISRTEGKIAYIDIHASILLGENVETIARSSEQYAEATNASARCRRNGEREPRRYKIRLVIS
jgi:hypothetical protein